MATAADAKKTSGTRAKATRASSSNGKTSSALVQRQVRDRTLVQPQVHGSRVRASQSSGGDSGRLHATGHLDYGKLLRRIPDAAELIEKRSDEVRLVSGQAKRITRKLA